MYLKVSMVFYNHPNELLSIPNNREQNDQYIFFLLPTMLSCLSFSLLLIQTHDSYSYELES